MPKTPRAKEDYSSVGIIGIRYTVQNPDEIKKCHAIFKEFCDTVDLVGHTHSPQAVELCLDEEGRVKIVWVAGGPLKAAGYSSDIPVFTAWKPVWLKEDGSIEHYGALSGKLPSGATFTIPIAC